MAFRSPSRRLVVTLAACVAVGGCAGTSPGGAPSTPAGGWGTSTAMPGTSSAPPTGSPGGATDPAGTSPGTPPGPSTPAATSPRLSPPPTPKDAAIRAVLTAFDTMDAHGPYRITLLSSEGQAFIEVVPPSRAHYYVTKGATVGEEITVDGAAWSRGPDGRWISTDGLTHSAPHLTVADVITAAEHQQGTDGARRYRRFHVEGTDGGGSYRATVTLWTDGRLRDVRLTTSGQETTTYTFTHDPKITVKPPATP